MGSADMKTYLPQIGKNLRSAYKRSFPGDDLYSSAIRIGVSRATLQKMYKGDLSISMGRYLLAAEVLGLEKPFSVLLKKEESVF